MKRTKLLLGISVALVVLIIFAVALLNRSSSVSNVDNNEDGGMTTTSSSENQDPQSVIGMPNPWSDAESIEDAVHGAGLEYFTLPDVFSCFAESYEGPALRYMDGLVEAKFYDENNTLVFRKGVGSEDVSGDYNTYPDNWEINWKGLTIACSGSDGGVRLARWYFGGNAYSLSFNSGLSDLPGLSEGEVTSLVNQIQ